MTDDQLASIYTYLQTNPSAEALAAAQQQYGVSNADLAAARQYGAAQAGEPVAGPYGYDPRPTVSAGTTDQGYSRNYSPEEIETIRGSWIQNRSDPQAVMNLMNQYGVSVNDLSLAMGDSPRGYQNYFLNAGADPTFGGMADYQPTNVEKAYIGWLQTQSDVAGPGTLAQRYESQGVNPFTDPRIITQAREQIERLNRRNEMRTAAGAEPIAMGPFGSEDQARKAYETYNKGIAALAQAPQQTQQKPGVAAPAAAARTPAATLQERATTFSNTFKTLAEDPTKTEYDVKKYLNEIRKDEELMKAYGSRLEPFFAYYDKVPDFTGDTTDYLSKQLQNQQNAGTAEYWKTGKKLSTDTATKYMADTLRKYGINDINQLGIKEVDVPEHTEMQGDSEAGYAEVLVPASKKKVFYNKATGEEITGSGYAKDFDPETGQFGRTTEGKGYTAFRVQFDKDTGKPIFYTTPHSSSDLGSIAPLLAMASFIPGVAPFAQGLNALIAAKQGNVAGALLSGLGAAGGIGQLAGASPQVLSNISTARNIAGVANAIQNKDILGLVSSGAQLGGVDLGATKIAGDITAKDAMFGVAAAKALDNKDYASLLNIAGQMSKNENLQTAAKGIMLADAIKSKNPAKLIKLVGSMAAEDSGLRKPRPAAASGGLLRGPGFVTVPDNAAVDPRVFSGIATPLMARSM